MTAYSVPTETARDILNIADALDALACRSDFVGALQNSSLDGADIAEVIHLLEDFAQTLPGEDE